ncbi:MAG TPA: element excision factor XisH family protein [Gemmataceae bacterium]|nr:element excision factor XisH family protein [Gemmataceae bacterium]
MPAKNRYHKQVVRALEKDGWTITHDPFHLKWGVRDLFVDLGAERLLAAEKDEQRIAVEIQSFLAESEVEDLQHAMGQFVTYRKVLAKTHPDRVLYMAVREATFSNVFEDPLGQLFLEDHFVRLLVFDPDREEVLRWIP